MTKFIPWLSLEDIVASTRLLGALTNQAGDAEALATKLWEGLAVAEAPNGPRVLVVLGESSGKLSEIYFVKRNSIHGAALRAAGARNAVASDVAGVPRLSIEELLRLDPEAIIVLVAPKPNGPSDADVLARFLGARTAHGEQESARRRAPIGRGLRQRPAHSHFGRAFEAKARPSSFRRQAQAP